MAINRRQFVQSSLLAGAGLVISPVRSFGLRTAASLLGVHPFILQNPDAVFVMRTNVGMKTDAAAIKAAGLEFGRSVFGLTDDAETGIPLTHKVLIKPNLTCRNRGHAKYTILGTMGIITDAGFVEGVIESLKELGIASGQFYIREVNCPDDLADGGYVAMAQRTGIDLQGIDTQVWNLNPDQVQWVDVPDGVWFRRIPYLWPVNAPGTFLLNISKFKAHGMGLTLCAKNLQGTIAMNYQAHCTEYGTPMSGVRTSDLNPTANADIWANYIRHRDAGIPRWDKEGNSSGGIWQETWATRCLDNNSVTFAGLHIIEGIYGRDGDFVIGPGSGGLATDYISNYIIFGRNPFHVDNIGHYLGGHEPGNFGLFHMAMERGMASILNPAEIPLYEWHADTGAEAVDLGSFQRYPLKTYYLQRNYNGQDEPYWHMVDEYYNYDATAVKDSKGINDGPTLLQSHPNPVIDRAYINFNIPVRGYVKIEVIDSKGRQVDVIVNKQLNAGSHVVIWDSRELPSGLYFCRMHSSNLARVQKIIVKH